MQDLKCNSKKDLKNYDIIVIGMGAAGLFALANLPKSINAIGLESQKSSGKKLLITGNGRCNLTNEDEVKTLVGHYNNSSFVRPIIYGFNNTATRQWFEDRGLNTISISGRIFPKSLSSQSVLDCLNMEISHPILNNKRVIRINTTPSSIEVYSSDGDKFSARQIIIAVGGASYPHTGSDGDLMRILSRGDLPIKIKPFESGLCSIYPSKFQFGDLAGIAVPVCLSSASLKKANKIIKRQLLFAHNHLSGPAIMDLSNYIKEGEIFKIDFLPDINKTDFEKKLNNMLKDNPKKQIKNILSDYLDLPQALVDLLTGGFAKQKSADLTRAGRAEISNNFKEMSLCVAKKTPLQGSVISQGGVDVDQINSSDMSLKKDGRVKIIGEALDISGHCGGYNLQFAFSSAYRAVRSYL